jgi:hypothetical protein
VPELKKHNIKKGERRSLPFVTVVTGIDAISDPYLFPERQPTGMEKETGSTSSFAKKIKLFSGPGTRRLPRFNISDIPSIRGVSSNAGFGIKVANISRGGALLQVRERLAPRARIQLNLVIAEGVIQLTGFVLRSSISSPKGMPRYQAAVAFNSPLQILDGQQGPTADTSRAPVFQSPPFDVFPSDSGESLYNRVQDGDSAMIAAFLAVSVCNAQDAALHEMLKLNHW